MNLIFNLQMPTIPQPTINKMELDFHCRADSQKRTTETVVPLDTTYTDSQLHHLLAFYGLELADRDKLTQIWIPFQTTKGCFHAGTELPNGFSCTTRRGVWTSNSIRNWLMISGR